MSNRSQRDMIEITYINGTEIKIYNGSCKNFAKVKQWVEDFNNGLELEDLITDDKHSSFLRKKDIIKATFNKAQAMIFF